MHETWFSVYVEASAPPGVEMPADSAAPDALMDLLEDHSGVVTTGTSSWGATVSVPADDPSAAVRAAAALVVEMAGQAGLPRWPLARAEAVREDVLEADLARPTLPEIVSVPEAAEILGVSAQRVRELAATSRDFPKPVYELRTGKLWLRAAMEAYAARRPRTPGRPAKSDETTPVSPWNTQRADMLWHHRTPVHDTSAEARTAGLDQLNWNVDVNWLSDALRLYVVALDWSRSAEPAWHWWKAEAGSADVRDISDLASRLPDADRDDVAEVLASLLPGSAA